jgi:hypothetical protein
MSKRAASPVLGLLSLSLLLAAQQANAGAMDTGSALTFSQTDIFSTVDSSVLIHDLPLLTLLDGRRFPVSSALGRMGMTPIDLFPIEYFRAAEVQNINVNQTRSGKDFPGALVNDSPLTPTYAGGEVGVLYGRSSGKFGGDVFQTYMQGEVGNDKFQISAGAVYQESSGRVPRFGR